MESLAQDLRHAVRRLRHAPGFTLIAVLTLALGIGANTAIFGVINGVLLRALPFANEDRLVSLSSVREESASGPLSGPDLGDFRERNRTLEALAIGDPGEVTVGGSGEPERLQGARVSADFFTTFGARPALGRAFQAGEDQPGAPRVAILAHGLALRRYGGAERAVGESIRLNGEPYEIVGVMPAGFDYPDDAQLWTPLVWDESVAGPDARGNHSLRAWGLLRPGVTVQAAVEDLRAIAVELEREYPQTNTGFGVNARPLRDQMVGDVRPALLVLLGAVGFVLLIACANLANLLLARAAGRQGEIAVRLALGAGRGRLVRQLLVESAVLALLGGAAGLLLASWGIEALRLSGPEELPRLDEVSIDLPVLGFTLGVSLATSLLFGLVPALQATRSELSRSLREAGRGGKGASRSRAANLLVVSETALAVVLLVGAGLLLRSFVRLQQVDPGFRAGNVLAVDLALPETSYPWGSPATREAYERLLERVRALPGVRAAGGSFLLPLTGSSMISSMVDMGRPEPEPGKAPLAHIRVVTPGYLSALAIPVRRGRLFDERDAGSKVVLISEEAARRYYPGEDPVGRTVEIGVDFGNGQFGGTIVGVVGSVRHEGLSEELFPEIYVPFEQGPANNLSLVIATTGDPMALAAAVRREVRAIDHEIPVAEVRTLETILGDAVAQPRFYALLLGIFSAVALVLAAVGIYGVVSSAVAHRSREFGIRMALGADGRKLIGMVVRQYLGLSLAGLGVGLLVAVAASRALTSLLFGVEATDPFTFAGVAVLLGGVALLASWLPARRATRVDPAVSLRQE